MAIRNYDDAIKYINAIPWTSRTVGLHRIRALMEALGRPDRKLKFIHVAGTNGKGSVCAMLASILKAAGFKTGLFTSPHLVRYNERMKVDGRDISDEELAIMIARVKDAADKLLCEPRGAGEEDCVNSYEEPSEFEILTAAGLLWFKEKECDIVVLEVGLGGEFDSTNVIERKEAAIITPLSYEHTAILGNTIEEIAKAKAGIITEGCDVVLALQNGSEHDRIENVIRSVCEDKNACLHFPDSSGFRRTSSGLDGQVFESVYYEEPMRLKLIGEYQLSNVLTVFEAVKVLNERFRSGCLSILRRGMKIERGDTEPISREAVRKGLDEVSWPARFEVLSRDPVFILDGAHNPHGVNAAVESLLSLFPDKKIVYIVGMLGDKNIDLMLEKLYINAKTFITLTPASERALGGDSLADRIRKDGFEAESFNDVKAAVRYAFKVAREEAKGPVSGQNVICSLGSLYLAGEIIKEFRDNM